MKRQWHLVMEARDLFEWKVTYEGTTCTNGSGTLSRVKSLLLNEKETIPTITMPCFCASTSAPGCNSMGCLFACSLSLASITTAVSSFTFRSLPCHTSASFRVALQSESNVLAAADPHV